MKRTLALVFIVALLGAAHGPADASVLSLQMEGLQLTYTSPELYDSDHASKGNLAPAQATPLASLSFWVDGIQIGSAWTEFVYADALIGGLTDLPTDGTEIVNASTGSFDVFHDPGTGADSWLQLSFDPGSFSLSYSGDGDDQATNGLEGDFLATGMGTASSIQGSQLPNGIVPGAPVMLSFNLSGTGFQPVNIDPLTKGDDVINYSTGIPGGNGTIRTFWGVGNGAITAAVVDPIPEPGTVLLLGAGLFLGVGVVLRKRI